jgi:hypothetical protein
VSTLLDNGRGSLRDAIATTPAGGTVTFQPGLAGTISLQGALVIDHDLVIDGPQDAGITVDAGGLSRVFVVPAGVTTTIDRLTIADGVATPLTPVPTSNADISGGGILNSGTLSLAGCTLTGNSASWRGPSFLIPGGGGVYSSGVLTVTNCTITGNSATGRFGGFGGGIASTGTLTVVNSTIAANSVFSEIVAQPAFGGGISSSNPASLTNTIVARNTTNSGDLASLSPDFSGGVATAFNNLIGVGTPAIPDGVSGNKVGTVDQPLDPLLGPLQDNGGPTPTMALLPGSPAINAGTADGAPPTDQRGVPRTGPPDIGAFESPFPPGTGRGFVGSAFGPFGQVVEVVSPDGTLTQFDAFGAHVLGGGVRSASVAFGPAGLELLVTSADGTLTRFSAAGAETLGGGVLSAALSYGPAGRVVDVVSPDGTLTQYDASGVHVLGGGVASAGSAFDRAGSQFLLVVSRDGTGVLHSRFGQDVLGAGLVSAAVSFDAPGHEVVDVISRDGSLTQFDAAGTHPLGRVF